MALYQEEVLDDEELLIQWGTHTSKKYVDKDVSKKVRSAAAPFIKVSFWRCLRVVEVSMMC